MDNAVHVLLLHEFEHALKVADVHLHETVVGLVLDVLEVLQVARIGELVQVDDPVLGVLVHEQAHDVTADEAGAAGDDKGFIHFAWCIYNSRTPRRPMKKSTGKGRQTKLSGFFRAAAIQLAFRMPVTIYGKTHKYNLFSAKKCNFVT